MNSTIRLKRMADVFPGQSPPGDAVEPLSDGFPFIQGNAEFTTFAPDPTLQCAAPPRIAEIGDLLISVRAPVGALNWAEIRLGIGRGLAAIRAQPESDVRFVKYALVAQMSELHSVSTGSTYLAVSADQISNLALPKETVADQRRIADFLDDQVSRIDNIISARRQQTLRLREQFDSFVNELFAKSSTRVSMRRLVSEAFVGIVVQPAALYTELGGVPALRGFEVKERRIASSGQIRITPEGNQANRRSQLRAGDVVVVRTGDTGSAAVVPSWAEGWNCIDLVVVRPGTEIDPSFVELVLNAAKAQGTIADASSGAMHQHFGVGALLELQVPLLGKADQESTVRAASEGFDDLNEHSVNLDRSIALLTEYKQSLITAAVTGELDVTTASKRISA